MLRTSSDLVRIDVEVTDKSGKPIKGLKQDQFIDHRRRQSAKRFHIFSYADIEAVETAGTEDAKPIVVPVDNEGPNAPSAEALSDQLRDRRLIVLFFDLTSMQPDDLIRAHDAAEKFVKQQMTKADIVARRGLFDQTYTCSRISPTITPCCNKAIAQLTANSSTDLSSPLYAAAAKRRIRRPGIYRRRLHAR